MPFRRGPKVFVNIANQVRSINEFPHLPVISEVVSAVYGTCEFSKMGTS